jgi:hypothetical protein
MYYWEKELWQTSWAREPCKFVYVHWRIQLESAKVDQAKNTSERDKESGLYVVAFDGLSQPSVERRGLYLMTTHSSR